jgi:hypothetical protein
VAFLEGLTVGVARTYEKEEQMKLVSSLAAIAIMLTVVSLAGATSVSYTATNAVADTNWANSLLFPKFDASLGTLTSVKLDLTARVQGSAGYENLDGPNATVALNLQALVKVMRPDTTVIVSATPAASTLDTGVATYDGALDFGGTSGKTYSLLTSSSSASAILTNFADLALFTGAGNITLNTSAHGDSQGSGPGEMVQKFDTDAGDTVTVTYNYASNTIPEPLSLSMIPMSLVGLVGYLRRRTR